MHTSRLAQNIWQTSTFQSLKKKPHTFLLPHTLWLKMRKIEKFIFKHINESQKEQFHRNHTWSPILEKIHIKYYKFKIIDVVRKSFSYFLKSLFTNTTFMYNTTQNISNLDKNLQ